MSGWREKEGQIVEVDDEKVVSWERWAGGKDKSCTLFIGEETGGNFQLNDTLLSLYTTQSRRTNRNKENEMRKNKNTLPIPKRIFQTMTS